MRITGLAAYLAEPAARVDRRMRRTPLKNDRKA